MILRSIFINLLFLLSTSCALAQFENVYNKSYAERREALATFYTDELNSPTRNKERSQAKVNRIQVIAQEHHDNDLLLECKLMQIHIDETFKTKSRKEIIEDLNNLYNLAVKDNVLWLRCRTLSYMALLCYIDAYNYEYAFNYAELLHVALQAVTKEEFPEKQICYSQIASFYYNFHEWNNALHYSKLGLQETPTRKKDQYQMLICNLMGLIHEKNQRYDSALAYYHKAFQSILPFDTTQYIWGAY